jgi:hypothetical protein
MDKFFGRSMLFNPNLLKYRGNYTVTLLHCNFTKLSILFSQWIMGFVGIWKERLITSLKTSSVA